MIGVIPAAGRGKRLGKISEEIPKPLVKIKGKTLLERCIESLKKHNEPIPPSIDEELVEVNA